MELIEYKSLLESAIFNWYFDKCKFPKDEAKRYTKELLNKIYEV